MGWNPVAGTYRYLIRLSYIRNGFTVYQMIAIDKMVRVLSKFLWFLSYEFASNPGVSKK